MKIAIVSHIYKPFFRGGAEISSELLARGLRDAAHESFVITAAAGEIGARTDEVDGVPVHRLKTGLPYHLMDAGNKPKWAKLIWHAINLWNPTVYAAVRNLLKKERPDVLHTNVVAGLSTSVWAAAHSLGIPVVHTLRDYQLICVTSALCKSSGELCQHHCAPCRLVSVWHRSTSSNVTAIVGISRFILEKHRAFGFFENLPGHIVHNAVPPEDNMTETSKTAAPGEPMVIVFMGTIAPFKGVEVMLKALTLAPDLPARLHLCGEGPMRAELQARYGGDKRVVFEGTVTGDRKRAILNRADVMLVPSIWLEPFGRTVIEGYQRGMAVVASRIGGLPELVEDGATGRLFEPGDSEQLASVLLEMATRPDLLAAMKQRAKTRARDFSLEKHVEEYVTIYRSLVE